MVHYSTGRIRLRGTVGDGIRVGVRVKVRVGVRVGIEVGVRFGVRVGIGIGVGVKVELCIIFVPVALELRGRLSSRPRVKARVRVQDDDDVPGSTRTAG